MNKLVVFFIVFALGSHHLLASDSNSSSSSNRDDYETMIGLIKGCQRTHCHEEALRNFRHVEAHVSRHSIERLLIEVESELTDFQDFRLTVFRWNKKADFEEQNKQYVIENLPSYFERTGHYEYGCAFVDEGEEQLKPYYALKIMRAHGKYFDKPYDSTHYWHGN